MRCFSGVVGAVALLAGIGITPLTTTAAEAASACTTAGWHAGQSNVSIYVPLAGSSENCQRNAHNSPALTATKAIQRAMGGECSPFQTYNGSIDGLFGPATYAALQKYQQNHAKVTVDGIYGKKTHNGMRFVTSGLDDCYKAKPIS